MKVTGYWRQSADKRLGNAPPWTPGAFSGQRKGGKTPGEGWGELVRGM